VLAAFDDDVIIGACSDSASDFHGYLFLRGLMVLAIVPQVRCSLPEERFTRLSEDEARTPRSSSSPSGTSAALAAFDNDVIGACPDSAFDFHRDSPFREVAGLGFRRDYILDSGTCQCFLRKGIIPLCGFLRLGALT